MLHGSILQYFRPAFSYHMSLRPSFYLFLSDRLRQVWLYVWVEFKRICRNDPKFSDREVWANSADPDQTAPRGAVWSGSSLFAIPFSHDGQNILLFGPFVWILGSLQQSFLASENLGTLR